MNHLRKITALFRKAKLDAEMAEEMRLHLELQAERNVAAGMDPAEARFAARRMFGGVEQIKEAARDQRGWIWLEQLRQDVRYAVRTLRRNPGFSFTAVTVLALGIGANAAVFGLVQSLLFAAPAYRHPAEVVRVIAQDKANPKRRRDFSYATYLDLRDRNEVFSGLLAFRLIAVGVGRAGEGRRAMAGVVTANYFSVLGVSPVRGRTFFPEEETPGREIPVAVVSYGFWKKRNFDPSLVGSHLPVNGHVFSVIGIMPEGFTGAPHLFATELWVPLGVGDQLTTDQDLSRPALSDRAGGALTVLGRLKPGLTLESAAPAMTKLAANLEAAFPVEQRDQTFRLERPSRFATGDNDRMVAWIGGLLLAMSGIVLLVASLNLASLLLARGAARRREMAIRLALGGGRARIVRQLLTEGLVLAVLGGVVGLLFALWSSDLLLGSLGRLAPVDLAWSTAVNGSLVAATIGFCLLATLGFALIPALKLSRTDITSHLKEPAPSEPVRVRRRFLPRNPLVVAQLALSLALLTAAALFIRSAGHAAAVGTGLKTDGLFVVELDATLGGYGRRPAEELYRRIGERFAALPGVAQEGVATDVPLGGLDLEKQVRRAGNADGPPMVAAAKWNGVGADYFAAAGLPLLRGRSFTPAEATQAGSPPVVIINEVLAKRFWPDGAALGQRLQLSETEAPADPAKAPGRPGATTGEAKPGETFEVIGIVTAVRHNLFESAPDPAIYLPFARGFQNHVFFNVKFSAPVPGGAAAAIDGLRRVVREVDATLPVLGVKSFAQHLDGNFQIWMVRAGAGLFSAFGVLALGLAVVGLYGVIAYSVARRSREIGIRMALGARPATVRRMILGEGAVTLVVGSTLGLLLALGIGKVVRSLLYQVSAIDPLAFAIASALLALTALAACWLPARRATQVDPLVALRTE